MSQIINIVVPEGDQQGTKHVLSSWLKNLGETIEENAPLVDLETDKVTMEIAAPATGILKEIFTRVGEDVGPGSILGQIECTQAKKATSPADVLRHSAIGVKEITKTEPSEHCLLSPAVRRLVKQHQLDISQITGTGKRGRVTKQDILTALEQQPTSSGNRSTYHSPVTMPTDGARLEAVTRGELSSTHVPHDSMRRKIADHMTQSLLHTAPHVTSIFEADLSAISKHRKAHKDGFRQKGVNLTFTAYFTYAAARALEFVPEINSRFHEDALEIFHHINIGIGTALEDKGLIVPVLKQVQTKNLFGIASELDKVTVKARNGTLLPADIQDGTFTISNHGVSGSLVATPIIINQPQSAILGIGKMEKRVVVREIDGHDSIQIRPMAYVSLTIDHRVLDAYQTNRFLTRFVEIIEGWQ
jgi:2-oxoglutarate dehydrogenase E2 component (dihydrolipoamide succinyltransferase)